jgi:pseudaminic acid biosynthesis-associated methylase
VKFKTEQERFWAGAFGSEYISRNEGGELLASNLGFFVKALASAGKIGSCIEFGANIGMNLRALKLLFPEMRQNAIEINPEAAQVLGEAIGVDRVFQGSILDYDATERFDLVLIKGVLIHMSPEVLPAVYAKLHGCAVRHLLVAEYYNPTPVAVPYRGHEDRLFKRDFAGELLDAFPDLRLKDYGFAYHRDPAFPQDDINWFLLERDGSECSSTADGV